MRKVLCIDQGDWNDATNELVDTPLTVGCEYHVLDVVSGPMGRYYALAEMANNMVFHTSLFVELPEETADEMQENAKESIVNLETVLV